MTNVPAQYQAYVNNAAQALGIPAAVVAAQINLESGFNPNARSYAGAVGIAQFLPSTFKSYGTGSPYNPADAFNAYTNYMKSLLNDFHGDLKSALAAYNAGPGNIGAGMGYASKVLSAAGSGNVTVANTAGGSGGSSSDNSGVSGLPLNLQPLGAFGDLVTGGALTGGIGDIGGALMGIVKDLTVMANMFSIIIKPAFWLRVGAFFVGLLFLTMGSVSLFGAIKN